MQVPERCDVKMFEYLELRSSILLSDIHGQLMHLRKDVGPGADWRTACNELKAKQDELEAVFDSIRAEIETVANQRESQEFMMRHFETTVNAFLDS